MKRSAHRFPLRRLPFFFYSNEGGPREPVHIHVERGDMEAKLWINPDVRVAYNEGFNARALREIAGVIESVEPASVRFDDDSMWVELSDGRTLGVPLAWFPRLLRATPEQRTACRVSSRGLHWEESGKDVSVAGLLARRGDATRQDGGGA